MGKIKKVKKAAPKIIIGSSLAFISPAVFLGGVMGYFSANYFNKKKPDFNIIFYIKNYKLHLHHWLLFPAVLILAVFFDFFLFSSHFFFGFLGGLAFQDIHLDRDWKKVITKNNDSN